MKTKKIILLTNVFVQLNLFIYQGTLFMSNNQHKKEYKFGSYNKLI